MLRRPFSSLLIFDWETSSRSATSSAVMPRCSRRRRSSWPSRRRRTVGLTFDATGPHLRVSTTTPADCHQPVCSRWKMTTESADSSTSRRAGGGRKRMRGDADPVVAVGRPDREPAPAYWYPYRSEPHRRPARRSAACRGRRTPPQARGVRRPRAVPCVLGCRAVLVVPCVLRRMPCLRLVPCLRPVRNGPDSGDGQRAPARTMPPAMCRGCSGRCRAGPAVDAVARAAGRPGEGPLAALA